MPRGGKGRHSVKPHDEQNSQQRSEQSSSGETTALLSLQRNTVSPDGVAGEPLPNKPLSLEGLVAALPSVPHEMSHYMPLNHVRPSAADLPTPSASHKSVLSASIQFAPRPRDEAAPSASGQPAPPNSYPPAPSASDPAAQMASAETTPSASYFTPATRLDMPEPSASDRPAPSVFGPTAPSASSTAAASAPCLPEPSTSHASAPSASDQAAPSSTAVSASGLPGLLASQLDGNKDYRPIILHYAPCFLSMIFAPSPDESSRQGHAAGTIPHGGKSSVSVRTSNPSPPGGFRGHVAHRRPVPFPTSSARHEESNFSARVSFLEEQLKGMGLSHPLYDISCY
jgi:hypothetical protein